jgi:hypothetical protein
MINTLACLAFAVLVLAVFIPQIVEAYFYQQGLGYTIADTYTTIVRTDKESYLPGERIKISGEVDPYDETKHMQITVMNSARKIHHFETIPVNPDSTFLLTIIDTSKWTKDIYRVLAQYGKDKVQIGIATFIIDPEKPIDENLQTTIPAWIKNNARWWADGVIDDSDFVQGIQYLIKEGVMNVPSTHAASSAEDTPIPAWIKNNARWWADGVIDDSDFVQGIQYLIKEGRLRV